MGLGGVLSVALSLSFFRFVPWDQANSDDGCYPSPRPVEPGLSSVRLRGQRPSSRPTDIYYYSEQSLVRPASRRSYQPVEVESAHGGLYDRLECDSAQRLLRRGGLYRQLRRGPSRTRRLAGRVGPPGRRLVWPRRCLDVRSPSHRIAASEPSAAAFNDDRRTLPAAAGLGC